ncbi:MAG: amidohydrolase [Clostridiaceae bacterium]|nr:amidohydrolase [Clostridiaceae bacterium]
MDKLEQKICDIIDSKKDEIIAFGRDIWTHAELGYREFRTAGKFTDALKSLGIETVEGLAVTGAKGYLKGKDFKGTTVALMGEYDALPIANHPDANPETGASHCCGHNAQITGVMGSAFALTDPEIKEAMNGNIVFFGVPAEEFVEVELKSKMIEEGKIGYGGGKCELIRIGAMDDIDITVGHHTSPGFEMRLSNGTNNGFVNKMITFTGKAAHASGAPQNGIDAYNAASLAKVAVDIQRESFRDADTVRIHGFTVKGGSATNVIADNVVLEYYVRANNIPAVIDASKKFDRAMRAGAVATGAGMKIKTFAGYLPLIPIKETTAMIEALNEANESCGNKYTVTFPEGPQHSTGSTDYGDVSSIMPTIQFGTSGFKGVLHNPDVMPTDEYLAYVVTAKVFALAGYKLLKNGGTYAQAMIDSFKAVMTKDEYIKYMDSMMSEESIDMAPLPLLDPKK